jgi:hypothetical protein
MVAEGFNIVGYQDAIVEKVKLLLPNTVILEDTIPDDYQFPRDLNGKAVPYVVLRFGPMLVKYRGRALAGARYDEYMATVDVMAVAPNGRMARQVCAIATDGLLGFQPDGTSPMGLRDDGGSAVQFVVASNEARPTQMIASVRMQYTINARNVGASP